MVVVGVDGLQAFRLRHGEDIWFRASSRKRINRSNSQRDSRERNIFVTSKLWGSDHHDPVAGLKQTLN